MNITVRLSDPLWREVGKKEIVLELPPETIIADLLSLLGERYPGLKSFLFDTELPPLVVLNDELVEHDTRLADGNVVLLVLAIAGG